VGELVARRLADGYRLPRAVIEAYPDVVQAHIDAKQKTDNADRTGLETIKEGDSGFHGGYFVRRTGKDRYRTETPTGYVEGNAAKVLDHIRQQQKIAGTDRNRIEDALATYDRSGKAEGMDAASGPGVAALRKLSEGTGLVVTDGGYRGRTGKLVKERDEMTGRIRLMMDLDGSPERIPVNHNVVEPLASKHSWRRQTATAAPAPQQGALLQGESAAPSRSSSTPAEGGKAARLGSDEAPDFANQQNLFDEPGTRQVSLFGAARKSSSWRHRVRSRA
jgi:hypothetical protein